uniref:Metastasis-associated protein MTA3 n=1 Tax=Mesocestoides corti TaxID=53468 RepID=A0A5K3ERS2_MESCO
MSSSNKYRVGDFVYFEVSATAPYQIRRLDELIMTPNGVEAKVTCYFRRRDISNTLIQQAEKFYFHETDDSNGDSSPALSDLQRHQVKHRELFHSRTMECLPATHIRGKCTVALYNEVEPLTSYVEREDAFYYRLIYDPSTKRLLEDRGSMRIGSDFQSEIQPLLAKGEKDPRFKQNLEEPVWNPLNSPPTSEMDTFISAVKAVGLYGRACDPASSQQHPLLINAAAAASRDVTLQFAHDILYKAGFDVQKAMSLLLPDGQPVVCKDELEAWTASEAGLFEEALGKYTKVFPDILTDFLPWKTSKSIVELYYFWKTTDRYIRHRKNKMVAKEQKLKQVYIPDYSKPNSAVLYNRTDGNDRGCECCYVESSPQWYAWGPPNLMCRLCSGCWTYWKKYGGLKNPDKRDRLEARRSAASAATVSTSPTGSHENTGVDHQRAPAHHPLSDGSLTSTIYRCGQPDCVKEFRSKDNLAIHLAQVHNVPTTSACIDPASVPVMLANVAGVFQHGAGTQCILTPASLRIVRTLCPLLLRPSVLARRPTKLANSTAQQRPPSEPIIPTDDLMVRLKTLAKSRIPALRDPQAVLNRKLPIRPLASVIRKLKLRVGSGDGSAAVSLKRPLDSGALIHNGGGDSTSGGVNTTALSINGDDQPLEKKQRVAISDNCGSNGHVIP